MRVDLDRQLRFPVEITATSLRPYIVVWSTKAKSALLIKLTIPVEGGWKPPTNARRPSTQSWLLSAGKLAGRPPSIQWRLDAKAA